MIRTTTVMLLFLQLFFGVLIASSLASDDDYVFQGLLEEKRQMTPIELRVQRGVETVCPYLAGHRVHICYCAKPSGERKFCIS